MKNVKNDSPAKTSSPAVSEISPRQRLFRLLDNGLGSPIVWISAPGGSGKTTLVASYMNACKVPCLWYHLDGGDADVSTFFYYMGQAAKRAAPGKKKPLPLLTPEYSAGIDVFTRNYFGELYRRLKRPSSGSKGDRPGSVIVFDNYQHVPSDSGFHDMFAQAMELLSEGVRVIVISRSEPPQQLVRLRAHNMLQLLGWNELRFTEDETIAIAKKIMSQKGLTVLPDEVIVEFHKKTMGWAAGLVLLLEQARQMDFNAAMTLSRLSEYSLEAVFEYFAGEIFSRIESEKQEFFLKTAFLSVITEQMAQELTGFEHAGRILKALHRMDFFIELHRGAVAVYQYHPLLREFLLYRAKTVFAPEEIAGLRDKSAALLEESGRVEDAAALLIETQNWRKLSRLILVNARPLISQGRTKTLYEWLSSLPVAVLERVPWLIFFMGVCRLYLSTKEARTYFEKAFHQFNDLGDAAGALIAWSSIVDSIVFEFGDLRQLGRWVGWFEDHISKHPEFPSPEIEFRAVPSMMTALMFTRTAYSEINPWVERTRELMQRCPDINVRIMTSTYMLLYFFWIGDLNKAGLIVKDIREFSSSPLCTDLNKLVAKYAEALYHKLTAYPDSGLKAAEEGIDFSVQFGIYSVIHHLYARAIFACLNNNDAVLAEKYLQKLRPVTDSAAQRQIIYRYHQLPACLQLLREDFAGALLSAEASLELCADVGTSAHEQAFSYIAGALALIGLREYPKAEGHLQKAMKIIREMKSRILEYTCLLYEALLFLDKGQQGNEEIGKKELILQGMKRLQGAFAFGREHGYFNNSLWYPRGMTFLCLKALEAGIETEYVRKLIRLRRLVPEKPPVEIEGWPWQLMIRTLGNFEIVRNDEPLRFQGKVQQKPLAMLKAIIAFGGIEVSDEQMTDALWPEADGDSAALSFRTNLHRLRQLIGSDKAIQAKDGRITLDPRYCWVDTWALQQIADKTEALWKESGDNLWRTTDDDRLTEFIRLSDKTITMYKGEFLPGERRQPWTFSMREKMKGRFIRVAGRLCSYYEYAGQWEKVIELYQNALEVDDLQEEFYRKLMISFHKIGRNAEALMMYDRCSRMLSSVLGIRPSAETETLFKSIKKS